MSFGDAINQLMSASESLWPENFVVDGDPKTYIGNWDMHATAQDLVSGGFLEKKNSTLVVRKSQFATAPRKGLRVTIDGQRYTIAAMDVDSYTYTFRLESIHK